MKNLIETINIKELRWDYFRGSGKGGQKRNKTENCARCTHALSKAQGKSEDGRSKELNKKKALDRLVESSDFQKWAEALVDNKFNEKRTFKVELEDNEINIYDTGKYIAPKRKEVKRKPVAKDKLKEERRNKKKDLKKYLG